MEEDIEEIREKCEEFCKKNNDVSVELNIISGIWSNDISETKITINGINRYRGV